MGAAVSCSHFGHEDRLQGIVPALHCLWPLSCEWPLCLWTACTIYVCLGVKICLLPARGLVSYTVLSIVYFWKYIESLRWWVLCDCVCMTVQGALVMCMLSVHCSSRDIFASIKTSHWEWDGAAQWTPFSAVCLNGRLCASFSIWRHSAFDKIKPENRDLPACSEQVLVEIKCRSTNVWPLEKGLRDQNYLNLLCDSIEASLEGKPGELLHHAWQVATLPLINHTASPPLIGGHISLSRLSPPWSPSPL